MTVLRDPRVTSLIQALGRSRNGVGCSGCTGCRPRLKVDPLASLGSTTRRNTPTWMKGWRWDDLDASGASLSRTSTGS